MDIKTPPNLTTCGYTPNLYLALLDTNQLNLTVVQYTPRPLLVV